MPVKRVVPSGYCMGVIKAINTARKVARDNPNTPVYVLGMLVHNEYVVRALEECGVFTLYDPSKTKYELLDEVSEGIVIFSAHGISDQIREYAEARGLQTVDASCPFVLNNRSLIIQKLDEGYDVLYIGKRNHPEAESVISVSPRVTLISSIDDVDKLPDELEKVFVTNQTTMSMYDVEDTMSAIRNKFPDALFAPEVCDATRMRQQAVIDLKDTDVLVVVGDPSSNNTAQLASIGKASGIKEIYKVETAADLKDIPISTGKNIAVTAGASTPRILLDNVIGYLEKRDPVYFVTDLEKMLDQ